MASNVQQWEPELQALYSREKLWMATVCCVAKLSAAELIINATNTNWFFDVADSEMARTQGRKAMNKINNAKCKA